MAEVKNETEEATTIWALDFDAHLPCEMPNHKRSEEGCIPEQFAEWIIELAHPGQEPTQKLVCDGRIIWLRGRMGNTVKCPNCGYVGPLETFVRIVGPIDGVK